MKDQLEEYQRRLLALVDEHLDTVLAKAIAEGLGALVICEGEMDAMEAQAAGREGIVLWVDYWPTEKRIMELTRGYAKGDYYGIGDEYGDILPDPEERPKLPKEAKPRKGWETPYGPPRRK